MFFRTTHWTWLTPLVLGLGAAYALSGVFMPPQEALRPRDAQPPAAKTQEKAPDPASVIMEKNILGLSKPAPEVAGEAGDNPVQAASAKGSDPADWPLSGTITGRRKAALIATPDGKVRLVFLGEIERGWELAEVREEGVVWRSGKTTREIVLRKEEAKAPEAAAPPKAEAEAKPASAGKVVLSKSEVAQYLDDPNNLLQQARFTPYKRDGKVEGFRLGNIRGDSIFRRMGLQNGDVLMSLNGERIDGPEKLLRVYSGLKSAQAVNVNVRRQGDIQSLMVEFQ